MKPSELATLAADESKAEALRSGSSSSSPDPVRTIGHLPTVYAAHCPKLTVYKMPSCPEGGVSIFLPLRCSSTRGSSVPMGTNGQGRQYYVL